MERADMKPPGVMRLFIAVPIPAEVKERIRDIQQQLQAMLPRSTVGWTRPEQIHLTLRFFGSVPIDQLDPLKTALREACVNIRPMELTAGGLGVFPDKRKPRIIWVGVEEFDGVLATLHKQISTTTAGFGQPPDARPFSPHLTIGRIKQMHPDEVPKLRQFNEKVAGVLSHWTVSSVELIKSDLGSDGSKYMVLAVTELG